MIHNRLSRSLWIILGALFLASAGPARAESGRLAWDSREQKVTADIDDWELPKLLERVSAATGWEIYIEPETRHIASVRFQDRQPGDALRLLLDPLSFALIPETGGPARLLVFETTAEAATERVAAGVQESSGDEERIPGELILTLKEGGDIDALARQVGARVVGRADNLNAYRLQFDDEHAADLAREPLSQHAEVESVEDNYSVPRPPLPQPVNFTGSLPFNFQFTPGSAPEGLRIGLIDTAVQPLGGDLDAFLLNPLSVAGGSLDGATLDHPTHGTAMALTILQAINGASIPILPVDIFGGADSTTYFEVGLGVSRAVEEGANIISMSFAGKSPSAFLNGILEQAHQHDVLLIAAAGNEPVATPTFPAAYPSVIAVTAGDAQGNIARYANHGDFVAAIAPGSTLVPFAGRMFHMTGTSVSSAAMAGTAAALAAERGLSPSEVEALIRQGSPAK